MNCWLTLPSVRESSSVAWRCLRTVGVHRSSSFDWTLMCQHAWAVLEPGFIAPSVCRSGASAFSLRHPRCVFQLLGASRMAHTHACRHALAVRVVQVVC